MLALSCYSLHITHTSLQLHYRLIRIKNAKKKRERDKKEQEQSAKKQLSNVRVVQKNLVYVLGLPVKLATEDTLKSLDFFGQYGRISKVVVNRRNPAVGPSTHSSSPATSNTGIYITFQRCVHEQPCRACEAWLQGRSPHSSYY